MTKNVHDLFISNKVEVLSSKNLFSFDLNIPRGMSKDIIFRRRSSLAARGARTKKLSSVFNFLVFGMTNRPLVAERVGSELVALLQSTSITLLWSFQSRRISTLINT